MISFAFEVLELGPTCYYVNGVVLASSAHQFMPPFSSHIYMVAGEFPFLAQLSLAPVELLLAVFPRSRHSRQNVRRRRQSFYCIPELLPVGCPRKSLIEGVLFAYPSPHYPDGYFLRATAIKYALHSAVKVCPVSREMEFISEATSQRTLDFTYKTPSRSTNSLNFSSSFGIPGTKPCVSQAVTFDAFIKPVSVPCCIFFAFFCGRDMMGC
mmetsp:Transcript_9297/g.21608  ORF Transcript_9297/g.21608 Transcript_9297/m.21608 type:complete len:211 (-) Transcript_9297:309-941(-)